MEQDISIAECHQALNNMNNGRSPGIDGYTTEFYKFFWSDLNTLLFVHLTIHLLTNVCPSVGDKALLHVFPKKVKIKVY